ncbi:MAG TPA: thiamine diphosphokinase [Treponema sp.]|nr:thiamine diphosphokinase [Treponema sp.]
MKRCVIVGGARISDYGRIKSYLRKDDFFIYCDGGLNHKNALGFEADLVAGDFDSFNLKDAPAGVELIKLPTHKDDTDVFFAAKTAVERGFTDFVLVGVTGDRLDHTMCNLSVLLYLFQNKKNAFAVDDYSIIKIAGSIAGSTVELIDDSFSYFSLMCISGKAEKVTIKNAEYPLDNATIEPSYQYAVSNRVLKGKTAEVTVGQGQLLLIKVF